MQLHTSDQAAFESFCRSELRHLFQETHNSVSVAIGDIEKAQISLLPARSIPALDFNFNSLFQSVEYSFFSGGKRFRPMLAFAGARYLDVPSERIFPWALAIEMIHTYSLIHDDLPSMDNDDFRRGQPTNHKVYGEPIALLAGDVLLTEAFGILSKHFASSGPILPALVSELVKVSGLNGMILGQYHDVSLDFQSSAPVISFLNHVHLLKTGALISGALMGAGILKNLSEDNLRLLKEVGLLLGYSFQVKDDILDAAQDKDSPKNLIYHFKDMGKINSFLESIQIETKKRIESLSKKLDLETSTRDSFRGAHLTQFLDWNIKRDK